MAPLQTAARVVTAIEYLATNGGAKLDEVAAALGVHKSSALRLLTTLRELGWIVTDDRHQYRVGPHLVAVGQAAATGSSLQRVLQLAEELRDLTNETVHIAVPQNNSMLIIGRVDSASPLRVSCELGSRDPLHTSSVGKAYLASLSETDFEALLPQLDLEMRTPFSITDADRLRDDIELTRRRGYSLDFEEGRLGVCCIGFAVQLGANLDTAALSITGPAHRWTRDAIAEMTPELVERVASASPVTAVAPT